MCVQICFFKYELCENFEPHTSEDYSFSPVYVRIWLFKPGLLEKSFATYFTRIRFHSNVCLHGAFQFRIQRKSRPQIYTFSSVGVCKRLFNSELLKNAEPHTSQEYGFSLVCVCICLFQCELSENSEPHISQEYGFLSVYFQIITHRKRRHILCKNTVSLQCVFTCDFSNLKFSKMLSHILCKNMVCLL